MAAPQTLFDKIWNDHVVTRRPDGSCVMYIDRLLVHEISSPQAFDSMRKTQTMVYRPKSVLAVADHDIPTIRGNAVRARDRHDEEAQLQVETLARNATDFGVHYFPLEDERHGITHVIGPEQGMILPGSLSVCCDSHAATYGAFGALGFGIGATESEGVLRTQTLLQAQPKSMRINVNGKLPAGVTAKDLILAIIGRIGTAGGTGYGIEYAGEGVRNLTMEGRMTLCNMTVEAGSRMGLIAPDEKTFEYLKGRPMAPRGELWDRAVAHWRTLQSDAGARFDKEVDIDARDLAPHVTWGTNPEEVLPITGKVPDPRTAKDEAARKQMAAAIEYMGLTPGMALSDIPVNRIFIGSCTNSRIEDLRDAARVVDGKRLAPGVSAMVVPGSGLVKRQAEEEGLDRIFLAAGFEWRSPGCSMCLAMNGDDLLPGERCASTSNRNFEHRQGRDGRVHLMSPAMAAAAAVTGRLTDVREFNQEAA
jgi:3-isopropylmalate/(R)-2-methylmalate dehydratase large subunit